MKVSNFNIFVLAFKNLGRHKIKTILTIIAIAVGVGLYNWMDSWLYGMNLSSKRNLINYETGAAKIYSKAYFEKKDEFPLYEAFGNYEPIIEKLNEQGYNAAPHAVFSGMLMSEEQELPFKFIGIDPELEKQVFKYNKFLETEDSSFVENGKFAALIGVRGAKDLDVKVGDKVRLSTVVDIKDEKGRVRHVHQLIDLSIGGILNTPNPELNGNVAYLPLDILQGKLGIMLNGRITELCIRKIGAKEHQLTDKTEKPSYILSKINDVLPGNLILVDWKEDVKDYLAASTTDFVGSYIMLFVLFILAAIGITNTMLMATFERVKEIGMLRAIGMKDNNITLLFLIEAGLIGFIGSIIGLLLALPADIYTIYKGIDYTSFMENANMQDIGYRVIGIFRGAWNPHVIIASPFAGAIIAILAALWPAIKAVNMGIADALRFE